MLTLKLMPIFKKLSITLISLLAIFIFNSASVLAASEESQPIKEVKEFELGNKWTETLRLNDFYLAPNTLEFKDKQKLREYKDTLTKLYKEHPSVFSAAIEYGLVLADLGEYDEASKVFGRAVNDFQNNPTPRVYKGWVDAYKGDYLSCKNLLLPIVKAKLVEGPSTTIWFKYQIDAVLGLFLIEDYLPPKDKEEAHELVDSIVNESALSTRLISIAITKHLQLGELKTAKEKLAKILEVHPNDPTSITLLGVTELIDGKYEEALKQFDKANEIYPDSPTNKLMRARALFALNEKDESYSTLDQAIALDVSGDLKNIKKNKLLASKSYVLLQDRNIKKLRKDNN